MKAKFGAIVVDGRGKLNGHVFTKNRQGSAMRGKVTPINRRSLTQQTARNLFASISQAWRGLTAAQRAAWESAAQDFSKHNIFGDGYKPTGKNLHMLINRNLQVAGSATVSSPPAATAPGALTSAALATMSTTVMTVSFAPTPVPANNALIIEATRPLSPGVSFVKSQFRYIALVAAAATSPANTFSAYTGVFGTPVATKFVYIRVTPVHTVSGIKGIPYTAKLVVS
jgi:hypothetical protein